MTTIINGLLGGLVAGVIGVLVTAAVARGARSGVWTARGDDGNRRRDAGVDILYGVAAGGAFVAAELFVLGWLGVPPTLGEALSASLAWSAALLVAVVLVRRTVLERRPDLATIAAFHLAYGLALGGWIRATWIT